jgi:hypothetical protein
MEKKYNFLVLICFLISFSICSQNTVGTILNSTASYKAYTLFTVKKETYLINNCGQVINQWSSDYNSGKSVYLLEDGNLLRASAGPNPGNIAIPGVGGRLELFDWEGNVLWQYVYSNLDASQHHDIYPMPNGNILILAASILTDVAAIQLGRNPSNLNSNQLYNEHILEIEPQGTNDVNIIWRWDFKDHLTQDFDTTKDNFAVISENTQLMDINFLGESNGNANWMHINSVQYNEDLDQIILGSKTLSEFYIIDHSTTTAQAASHSGGIYGKGGDLLYRWGNPQAYKQGDENDQKLFGQHNPHWIPNGLLDEGKIILFNNGVHLTTPHSEINIISPPTSAPGIYIKNNTTSFGPENPDYTYTSAINTDFYSPILSSAQRLQNDNILICEGTSGRFFEIDSNNEIVWEYISPISSGTILTQGETPSSNNVFRAKKYALNYAGFANKDLTPGDPIEIDFDISNCNTLSTTKIYLSSITAHPNPVKTMLSFNSNDLIEKIEVFNSIGKKVITQFNKNKIDFSNITKGIYHVKIYLNQQIITKKVLKL